MDIKHVVVLMLENRSFDCMLGMLYQSGDKFDGLTGTEFNTWHKPDGSQQDIQVWKDPTLDAKAVCVPDPDPGERFTDIHMQIHGPAADGTPNADAPAMGGFVDNYIRQPPTTPVADPYSVTQYFTPDQVPVISQLARAFGVSDRWHASAPCQTWPNRFFAHTGTAIDRQSDSYARHHAEFGSVTDHVRGRLVGGADQRVLNCVAIAGLDRQAEDRLHHFQFAIMIAPGNVRPCRGQSYVPRFGMLLLERTRMVCSWRKTLHRERGSGR
jgi:phosphoesterase family protein